MDDVLFNHAIRTVFASVALVLCLAATFPYRSEIRLGNEKPSYLTYIGWTLAGVTQFFIHLITIGPEEDKLSLIFLAGFAAAPAWVLVTMIRAGVPFKSEEADSDTKRDVISYAMLGLCWLAWVITRVANMGPQWSFVPYILLATTDLISSWPMFKMCLAGKESGAPQRISWSMTAMSTILELFTVGNPWSEEMFIPGYLSVYMCAIAAASLFSAPADKRSRSGLHVNPAE